MLPRPRRIPFSIIFRAASLAGIFLLLSAFNAFAQQTRNQIVIREEVSLARREQLVVELRRITGLPNLKFDERGVLVPGNKETLAGSESARALISKSIHGPNLVVIEEAPQRSDVAFCRVNPGKWTNNIGENAPVFVVQVDFADFDQVVGDKRALEAFNVGWGFLHELDHIVNDSLDATSLGETGECESHINQMRRECNLPERAEYFHTLLPLSRDSTFMTRLVRLAFEQEQPNQNRKKRYWLLWDANAVGGLNAGKQVASRR